MDIGNRHSPQLLSFVGDALQSGQKDKTLAAFDILNVTRTLIFSKHLSFEDFVNLTRMIFNGKVDDDAEFPEIYMNVCRQFSNLVEKIKGNGKQLVMLESNSALEQFGEFHLISPFASAHPSLYKNQLVKFLEVKNYGLDVKAIEFFCKNYIPVEEAILERLFETTKKLLQSDDQVNFSGKFSLLYLQNNLSLSSGKYVLEKDLKKLVPLLEILINCADKSEIVDLYEELGFNGYGFMIESILYLWNRLPLDNLVTLKKAIEQRLVNGVGDMQKRVTLISALYSCSIILSDYNYDFCIVKEFSGKNLNMYQKNSIGMLLSLQRNKVNLACLEPFSSEDDKCGVLVSTLSFMCVDPSQMYLYESFSDQNSLSILLAGSLSKDEQTSIDATNLLKYLCTRIMSRNRTRQCIEAFTQQVQNNPSTQQRLMALKCIKMIFKRNYLVAEIDTSFVIGLCRDQPLSTEAFEILANHYIFHIHDSDKTGITNIWQCAALLHATSYRLLSFVPSLIDILSKYLLLGRRDNATEMVKKSLRRFKEVHRGRWEEVREKLGKFEGGEQALDDLNDALIGPDYIA